MVPICICPPPPSSTSSKSCNAWVYRVLRVYRQLGGGIYAFEIMHMHKLHVWCVYTFEAFPWPSGWKKGVLFLDGAMVSKSPQTKTAAAQPNKGTPSTCLSFLFAAPPALSPGRKQMEGEDQKKTRETEICTVIKHQKLHYSSSRWGSCLSW